MRDQPPIPRRPGSRGGAYRLEEAFAARRRRQLLVLAPLFLIVVAIAALADPRSQAVLGVPASTWAPAIFSAIAGAVAYTLYNWRCPACNKYLGRQPNPRSCGTCGARLR